MGDFGPAYLTAIIKFTEFWLKIDQAPEETRIFCSAVERIRQDRSIAQHERDSRGAMLDRVPDLRNWIDGILEDTEQALRSVGRLLERFRIDFENGKKIGLGDRLKWVLAKRDEFLTKSNLLTTCHQSLSSSILAMRMMDVHEGQSLVAPPAYTRAGVEPPTSVVKGSIYSSVSDDARDDQKLAPPVMMRSKEIESDSLGCRASRTEKEGFASSEKGVLPEVSIPAGSQTRFQSDAPSNQERRRRRHVFFAREDHDPIPHIASPPRYSSGQGRSARRAMFFQDMKP